MRFLAAVVLAIAIWPTVSVSQETLDTKPMTWRGVLLGPEQIFEGDYAVNFETSIFKPDGAANDAVWLAGWEDRPGDNGGAMRRYHLRFIGRQNVEPGRFGSLGAYGRTVLITRLISARLLIRAPDAGPTTRP